MVDAIEAWQQLFLRVLGRRMVFAADEYYLMAGRPFPAADSYEGFAMHEDGVGMATTFELEFTGAVAAPTGAQSGFFAWVDGAPAEGYRAVRAVGTDEVAVQLGRRGTGVLTGAFGAKVLAPLLADQPDVRIVEVENRFFGGNIGVTGLMVGEDIARALLAEPAGHRYLLPDVCLSQGRFLDGMTPDQLPRPVEIVPTDGGALREALGSPVSAGVGARRRRASDLSTAEARVG
jgi:NifB/MoaA-like Fe-S oxidoreductase